MDGSFEKTFNETWLVLPEEVPAEEYACRQLEHSAGPRLLRLKRRQGRNGMEYAFSIPPGNSVAGMFRLRPMTFREMALILSGIAEAVEEAEEGLLECDHLILAPELIFAVPDLEHLRLCCHPGFRKDFFEQLRELIRYFLRKIDHRDTAGTEAAYRLFEVCEQEYFRLEDLMLVLGQTGRSADPSGMTPPAEHFRSERTEKAADEEAEEAQGTKHRTRLPEAALLFACTFFLLLFFWSRIKNLVWDFRFLGGAFCFACLFLLLALREHREEKQQSTSRGAGTGERRKRGRQDRMPAGRARARETEEPEYCLVPQKSGWGGEVVLRHFPFVIGKLREEAGLLLDTPSVSRIHARITREGDQLLLTDCHSMYGTFVNEFRLPPDSPYPLMRGDVIRFADIPYRLE